MWKGILVILAVGLICVDARASVKAIRKPRQQRSHAEWIDDNEEDKRDAIRKPNAFGSYQYPQAAPVATAYNAAARSTAPSSSNTGTAAAPAQAFAPSAPVAAPAQVAAAPAPAAAAPAPAPAAAAPAPAPAAPSAAAAPAPVRSVPSTSPSSVRSATPYYPQTQQQQSSVSSSYSYYPRAAPSYYYSPPAPAAYAPSTATATVAAAVAQAAKSTLTYAELLKAKPKKTLEGVCGDDTRADSFCKKAHVPCFCEENHHFMYNYCKRSCNWCDTTDNGGHRYWRISNLASMPRSWIIKEIELFTDKAATHPIKVDASKAFASTTYPGFPASNAFDGNEQTYWLPEGWYERYPGMDYIGIEFAQPVAVNAVRVKHETNEKNGTSSKMDLEYSDFYSNNYVKKFVMENPHKKEDKKYAYRSCPTFWRRYETNDDIFCLRSIPEFLTWQQARDKCATFGADLASIGTISENMFINNGMRICGFTWLGLKKNSNESDFTWSDGTPVGYKGWAGDEQYYEVDEQMIKQQNCVAASRTGEWRPFHCENKFYSICQMKLKPDDDDDLSDKMETHGHYHHLRVSKKSEKIHAQKPEDEDDEDEDDDEETKVSADEAEVEGDSSEDALKTKKAEEDEKDKDEDEQSGADAAKKAHRREEVENTDDSFLDF
ncbi:uncharacterized protein LOC5519916 isoform X2 [Nematostella vectensis]|uniref:uncharacterized protein LOC5519916 isoform X2 n=1 Tax=Nematostella vectensis TaxID=45351 RepID=UPI0020773BA0|nr:uncharacterized protein LOC5519916 isoform X2 [Nematostella vectensis]